MDSKNAPSSLKNASKNAFLFLMLFLGLPLIFQDLFLASRGLDFAYVIASETENSLTPQNLKLTSILNIFQSSLRINAAFWLVKLLLALVAYFGGISIWIRHFRNQEPLPYSQVWLSSIRLGLFRGSLAFFGILFFVGPLQIWSLVSGNYLLLLTSIALGGLLLMAPVILTVETSMSLGKALFFTLKAKYARPPIQENSHFGTTLLNLSLLYMLAYGFFSLALGGERFILNLDQLPLSLHKWFYQTTLVWNLSAAHVCALIWYTLVQIFITFFVTFFTSNLYFALATRRLLGKA